MKKINCLFLMIVIANCANAQGLSKYGQISTDAATGVNKNGGIGTNIVNNKNGKLVTIVPSVVSTTGKRWMDRNLGASQVATSSNSNSAYGSFYQWGRGSDGHQLITWTSTTTGTAVNGTTPTLAISDTPGTLFITSSAHPFDWRSGQNASLWQGVNGTNNPCPSGYRIPTAIELDAERAVFSTQNSAGAFASPLKLTTAGYRLGNGSVSGLAGSNGYYWTSTVLGVESQKLIFNSSTANMAFDYRVRGLSVRCILD